MPFSQPFSCSATFTLSSFGHGDENYSAIQLTTASGVCSVLKMYLDGKISNKGFVKQESLSWNDFIENKFGQVYA
jgi:saccharopine dehydrogenase-like NADP-dependent oxidoreductase